MNITLVDSSVFPNSFMGKILHLPPLGLLSLAGAVEDIADKIRIMDDRLPSSKIIKNTDILGVRAMIHNVPYALNLLKKAKEINPDIKTIIGGFHATLSPEDVNKEYIDYIVRGEGEKPFREIILGKLTTKIVESPMFEDLDDLPFPAYDLVNISKYQSFGVNTITLETSRGCPFRCNFCSVRKFFNDTYRAKSIPRVIDEIQRYTKKTDVAINFVDDNHTVDVKHSIKLCEAIIENDLNHILFFCQSRVDILAKNPELVKKMADAGYWCVFLGVESPYQASLDGMNKKQTWEQAKEAVRLLNDYGILSFVSIVIGSPNETEEMIRKYPKYIKELKPAMTQFCVLSYGPGAERYEEMKQRGEILLDDYSFCSGTVCNWKHPLIDPRKLNQLYMDIQREYYTDIHSYIRLFQIYNRIFPRLVLRRTKYQIKDLVNKVREVNFSGILKQLFSMGRNYGSNIYDLYHVLSVLSRVMMNGGSTNPKYITIINQKIDDVLLTEK